jgi:hypothetical protein
MQVSGHAGPRRLAEVQADVEPCGIEHLFQEADHLGDGLHHFLLFVLVEFIEPGDVPPRGHQEVSIVIRIPIQHRDCILAPLDHESLTIVARGGILAKETGRHPSGE